MVWRCWCNVGAESYPHKLKGKDFILWMDVGCQPQVDLFIKAAMFRFSGRIPADGRSGEISRQNPDAHKTSSIIALFLLDSTLVARRRNKENKLYIFIYKCLSFFLLLSQTEVCNPLGRAVRSIIQQYLVK